MPDGWRDRAADAGQDRGSGPARIYGRADGGTGRGCRAGRIAAGNKKSAGQSRRMSSAFLIRFDRMAAGAVACPALCRPGPGVAICCQVYMPVLIVQL